MPAQFSNSDSGTPTPQLTPFDSILTQCRDLVCERLSAALSGMLDKVDDALSALINETREANAQKLYSQTRDKALAQREAIEKQFRTRYLREFQQRSNRVKKIGDSFSDIDLSSLELELVGEEDLDETLKFNALAAKLRQYCDEELIALDQRVGVLLGDASLQAEDNPFTPQAICDAYKDTCRQLDSNVEVRMVLLRLFDDHVVDEIRAVYKAVNGLLVQNSILPKIRLSARKEGGKPPPPAVRPAAEPPKTIAQAEQSAADGEPDLFSILKNLRANNLDAAPQSGAAGGAGPNVSTGAGAPAPGGMGTPAVGGAGGVTGATGNQPVLQGTELLGLLTRIQLGDASAVPGNILSIANATGQPGMANVLRELKGSSVGTGMNQLDMMTLDIMSLVFDQLFDDPKIPVGVKGLIGRLQIPMLKVAIADKTFFSKKTHPARQLLDTLGEISLRLPVDFNASSPLFGRMEVILQGLIDGFENNMDVFDDARARLETLITEEDHRVGQETQSAANQIEQKERLALAKTVAQAEIRARVRVGNVPVPVLEFLIQQWVQVLLVVHVVDGEDSEMWKNALDTMDLLIWSVEPKATLDERRELAAIVPEVRQRLAAGLRLVSIEDAVRSDFFAELRKLHGEIIGKPARRSVETRDAGPSVDTAPAAAASTFAGEPLPVPSAESAPSAPLEFAPAPGGENRPVPAVEPVSAAGQPARLPDLELVPANAAEVTSVRALEPEPVAKSAPASDLEFVSMPAVAAAPVPEQTALAATPGPVPDLEFVPAPAAQPASVPELVAPAEKAGPVKDPEFAPAAVLLPDLEFTLAPSQAANAPAAESAATPTLAAPTAPAAQSKSAHEAEFVSIPELKFERSPSGDTASLPELKFAFEEAAKPTPVVEPVPTPEAKAAAGPVAQAAPAAKPAPAPPAQERRASDAKPAGVPEPADAKAAAEPTHAAGAQQSLASTAKPAATQVAQPSSAPSAKLTRGTAPQPTSAPSAKPVPAPTAQHVITPAAKPGAQVAHPGSAAAGKQTPAAVPQPAPTPAVKPAPPPPARPASATQAPPGSAPATQPVMSSVAKPAIAPAAQPVRASSPGQVASAGARAAAGPAQPVSASAGSRPAPGAASMSASPLKIPPTSMKGNSPVPPSSRAPSSSNQANTSNLESLDFTAPVTVKNPFGGGKVQVDDLDFTTIKPAAGTVGAKREVTLVELPANLVVETWVGIREKDETNTRRSAKLSYISPLKTRYLFVDRQGKTTLDCSRADLARRFALGEVVIMDKVPEVPLFDRLTEGLVGKLGGAKSK